MIIQIDTAGFALAAIPLEDQPPLFVHADRMKAIQATMPRRTLILLQLGLYEVAEPVLVAGEVAMRIDSGRDRRWLA